MLTLPVLQGLRKLQTYAFTFACLAILTYRLGTFEPFPTLSSMISNDNKFQFLAFYDDKFNFLDFPELNSLFPLSVGHWNDLFKHVGINVYEPLSSFLKAAVIDLVGFDAHRLHIVSVVVHFLSTFQLWYWLNVLHTNDQLRLYKKSTSSIREWLINGVVCLFFQIHPLNMEVIGWLSAQSYSFSLFFSLLSSISLEKCIADVLAKSNTNSSKITWNQASVVIFYILACACKAPALTLPGVHLARLFVFFFLLKPIGKHSKSTVSQVISITGNNTSSAAARLILGFFCVLGVTTGVLYRSMAMVNSHEGAVVPPFDCWFAVFTRMVITVNDFTVRIIMPSDLRAHYVLEDEPFFSWANMSPLAANTIYWRFVPITVLTVIIFSLYSKIPTVVWGWFSYLIMWLPGCGLIAHGWSQMGADRYCYFPLAFLMPALQSVLLSATSPVGTLKEIPSVATASLNGKPNDNSKEKDKKKSGVDASTGAKAKGRESKTSTALTTNVTDILTELGGNSNQSPDGHQTVVLDRIEDLTDLMRLFFVLLVCSAFLIGLSSVAKRQLLTWRNDKTLLEHCVRIDPRDYECHQYLGSWYGYHESNEALAMRHNELAVQYVPTTNPKALLFKAQILFFIGKRTDACTVVESAYQQLFTGHNGTSTAGHAGNISSGEGNNNNHQGVQWDVPSSAIPQHPIDVSKLSRLQRTMLPYVVNNWVLCQAIKLGAVHISDDHARAWLDMIHGATTVALGDPQKHIDNRNSNSNSNRNEKVNSKYIKYVSSSDTARSHQSAPSYLIEGLQNHTRILENWLRGEKMYGAHFIW